jgi:hypothetical protein
MLSVITVVLMPSRSSSQAVSRAPCRNGRVAADHAEGGAVSCSGQRASVAVREDPGVAWDDCGAEGAHRTAARHIFVVDRFGFTIEPILDLIHRLARLGGGSKRPFHPVDGPEQIDGGRSGHHFARLEEFGGEFLRTGRRALPHPNSDAHRGRHADCRRAADHHALDRLRDFRRRAAADVHFLPRQLALIDHDNDVVFAGDGREHDQMLIQAGE